MVFLSSRLFVDKICFVPFPITRKCLNREQGEQKTKIIIEKETNSELRYISAFQRKVLIFQENLIYIDERRALSGIQWQQQQKKSSQCFKVEKWFFFQSFYVEVKHIFLKISFRTT